MIEKWDFLYRKRWDKIDKKTNSLKTILLKLNQMTDNFIISKLSQADFNWLFVIK
jgi:hypothetical protein